MDRVCADPGGGPDAAARCGFRRGAGAGGRGRRHGTVRQLLRSGADVNAADPDGAASLHWTFALRPRYRQRAASCGAKVSTPIAPGIIPACKTTENGSDAMWRPLDAAWPGSGRSRPAAWLPTELEWRMYG